MCVASVSEEIPENTCVQGRSLDVVDNLMVTIVRAISLEESLSRQYCE